MNKRTSAEGQEGTQKLSHGVSSTARWLHGPPAPLQDAETLNSGLGLKLDTGTGQFSKDYNRNEMLPQAKGDFPAATGGD